MPQERACVKALLQTNPIKEPIVEKVSGLRLMKIASPIIIIMIAIVRSNQDRQEDSLSSVDHIQSLIPSSM